MDAASAAAMSDPDRNPWFRRRWSEPSDIVQRRQGPPEPNEALDQIGSALREQWRREQKPARPKS